jgi:hypothetical protein
VGELRQLACDHVAFQNDLVSFHREVVRAGCSFNLLHALAVLGCEGSLERAVGLLVQELNVIATRFEALAANTRRPVVRHAQALRSARHTEGPPAIRKMPNTAASTPDPHPGDSQGVRR